MKARKKEKKNQHSPFLIFPEWYVGGERDTSG